MAAAAALEETFQDIQNIEAIDDQEEGEIVDESDDSNREFESISDNSLESLPSIENEDKHFWKRHLKKKMKLYGKKKSRLHHRYHHHHHSRLHRHHHHHRSSSIDSNTSGSNHHGHRRHHHHHKFLCSHSDSSSEEYMVLDKSILKAAVRVNNGELNKNSLSSRLKAMLDNKSPEIQEGEKSLEQKDNEESGKEDDELIQLRLAALRTAILNKKKFRKKRKLKEMQSLQDKVIEISDTLDNKENDEDLNPNKKPCLEMTSNVKIEETKTTKIEINKNTPSEDDDDEDVLRALLLASMSKKITRETKDLVAKENQNINFHKHKHHYNMKKPFVNTINKINNKIIKPPMMIRPLLHTKVSPLIINLKDDSETDEDANKSRTATGQSTAVESKFIENSVEKFLKEQRAKIEAQKKKKESDKPGVFEKSCVKLLPKSKQIEYHNLLQKLKNAQKVSQKTKKVQNKISKDNNQVLKNPKKLVRAKPTNNDSSNSLKQQPKNGANGGGGSVDVPDLVKDARDLQKVIREMQSKQSNGRLQMQAKYTSLTPIVKKINEASIERKKCDKEVKRLLEELTEAKKKLRDAHIHFKTNVRELIGKKEEIDKKPAAVKQQSMVTSTPLKKEPSIDTCQSTPIKKEASIDTCQSTPIKKEASIDTSQSSPIIDTKDNCNKEISSVSDKEFDDSINLGDPNDIDKIYCTVPKYVSPLDNTLRTDAKDPFLIMCPYDIDGNCKDSECTYKHYRG